MDQETGGQKRGRYGLVVTLWVLIIGLLMSPVMSARASFVDPLDAAAASVLDPSAAPLLSVAKAGDHFVAVGPRGVIVIGTISSDGMSVSWRQVAVPVQSDLVKVLFTDSQNGWACGHDGVILRSNDGGMHWTKVFDGIAARKIFEAYYQDMSVSTDKSLAAAGTAALDEIKTNFDGGPSLPWLGMAFTNADSGYVVGPFGDIAMIKGAQRDVVPLLDRIDNPNFYSLNGITSVGDKLYIAAEQGIVYAYDPVQQKFVQSSTGYQGNLFGIVGTQSILVAYGMNGTVYCSTNGAKSWVLAKDASTSTIMNGVVLPDGRIVLVTVDGTVLMSADQGKSFSLLPQTEDMPLADVTPLNAKTLIVVGLGGVRYVGIQ
jgi:photosystem II stability/assembly factor-like uncharacterized protein